MATNRQVAANSGEVKRCLGGAYIGSYVCVSSQETDYLDHNPVATGTTGPPNRNATAPVAHTYTAMYAPPAKHIRATRAQRDYCVLFAGNRAIFWYNYHQGLELGLTVKKRVEF